MKKGYFVLLFTLTISFARAQAQPEFAPAGATWYFNHYTDISQQHFSPELFVSQGATTYKSQPCKMVKGVSIGWSYNETYYMYTDSLHLYYVNPGNNKWTLLADFTKTAGDTFYIDISDTAASKTDSIPVRVIARGDTMINGYTLPYIITNGEYFPSRHGDYWYYGGKIIQNIGSHDYLVPLQGFMDPSPGPLRCYIDSNLTMYKNPFMSLLFQSNTWECDTSFILAAPEVNAESKLTYYQSGESIYLKHTDANWTSVALYNVLGREILRRPAEGVRETVLTGLHTGIYFLQANTSAGIYTFRVVKQ